MEKLQKRTRSRTGSLDVDRQVDAGKTALHKIAERTLVRSEGVDRLVVGQIAVVVEIEVEPAHTTRLVVLGVEHEGVLARAEFGHAPHRFLGVVLGRLPLDDLLESDLTLAHHRRRITPFCSLSSFMKLMKKLCESVIRKTFTAGSNIPENRSAASLERTHLRRADAPAGRESRPPAGGPKPRTMGSHHGLPGAWQPQNPKTQAQAKTPIPENRGNMQAQSLLLNSQ